MLCSIGLLVFWMFSWNQLNQLHAEGIPPSMSLVKRDYPVLFNALSLADINLDRYPFGQDASLASRFFSLSFLKQVYFSLMIYCLSFVLVALPRGEKASARTRLMIAVFLAGAFVLLVLALRCHFQYADLLDVLPGLEAGIPAGPS
jgi:hypothetical protein